MKGGGATPPPQREEHLNEKTGEGESKQSTQLVVLTAPELVGGVKVGEERVKLVGTEERIAAGLRAAGSSSYAGDDGSWDITGVCKMVGEVLRSAV